jgi:hypothetical protein
MVRFVKSATKALRSGNSEPVESWRTATGKSTRRGECSATGRVEARSGSAVLRTARSKYVGRSAPRTRLSGGCGVGWSGSTRRV